MNAPARIIPASGIQYPLLLLGEPGRQPDSPRRRHPAKSTAGATAARTKETAQEENPPRTSQRGLRHNSKKCYKGYYSPVPATFKTFSKKVSHLFFRGAKAALCFPWVQPWGSPAVRLPFLAVPCPFALAVLYLFAYILSPAFPWRGGGRRPTERSVLHD